MSPLPAAIAPRTGAEGAAVQYALAELAGAVPPAGFKLGATGNRMQIYLGVNAPIAGFMRTEDLYHGQADLRFADFINPGVECEVAVRLAHDLPPGPCSLEQAINAVGDFFAGIEIVENRYTDLTQLGTPILVADQMYHCAAVIGDRHDASPSAPHDHPPRAPHDEPEHSAHDDGPRVPTAIDWRELNIAALHGRITLDNGIGDAGTTTDLLGHPLNGLAWLAGSLQAAAFGGLRAGQVVMLGSVTPPLWLTGPATATVEFPPLPRVTVRLR